MKYLKTLRRGLALGVAVLALSGCEGLLDIQDPQRYTSDDLDDALEAVANGVEGAFHEVVGSWVIDQALLSDEYQHTGTWSGYDEVDHGRFQYGTSTQDGEHNAWLRARWFAQDSQDRFIRVLGESEAASSPLMAQVQTTEGLIDLYIGMTFCESPAESGGPSVSDTQILQQAIGKLTTAMQTASAAGTDDYRLAAQAGRAVAHLLLGDYGPAVADAQAIPEGFSYDAVHNQSANNAVVVLTTKTFNAAAGLMYPYWDRIPETDAPAFMADYFTGEPDPRIPVFYNGDIATDNETGHRSQWKYNALTDDIPLLHSDGMRLIEAEKLIMVDGDFAAATAILNDLRAAVGLDPLPVPADMDTMMEFYLGERFAEHFMEGWRRIDLHRFGLMRDVFAALDDPERPADGRPTQWPMTDTEALYNANIENDLTVRCLPKT